MSCNKSGPTILLVVAIVITLFLHEAPEIDCKRASEQESSSSSSVQSRSRRLKKLSYSILEGFGVACPPRDTCRMPRTRDDNLLPKNCECDEHCARFRTCCVDSPFLKRKGWKRYKESCVKKPNDEDGVFMIASCKKRWRGDHLVRLLCEQNTRNLSDPFRHWPLTNPTKQVTYRNEFCAFCNNEKEELVRWSVAAKSDVPVFNSSIDNLVYAQETNSWGIRGNFGPGESVMIPVRIEFDIPGSLSSSLRFCQSDLISSCASTWTDVRTKRKCDSYMAPVTARGYDSSISFRNPHCALCNHVMNLTSYYCLSPADTVRPESARPISFAVLLDLNKSDGDIVGRTSRCKENEAYDPFFKKCRSMACARPGYVIRGRKCVPP